MRLLLLRLLAGKHYVVTARGEGGRFQHVADPPNDVVWAVFGLVAVIGLILVVR